MENTPRKLSEITVFPDGGTTVRVWAESFAELETSVVATIARALQNAYAVCAAADLSKAETDEYIDGLLDAGKRAYFEIRDELGTDGSTRTIVTDL